MTNVWLRCDLLRPRGALLPAAPRWMTASEQARWVGFRNQARRDQFEAGRFGLRQLLAASQGGEPMEWQLEAPREGPPRVSGSPVPFSGRISIAHSGPWVLTAVAAGPVGIDIEQRRGRERDWDGWQRLALTPREAAVIASQPDREAALLMHWTAKEALGKAEGTGVTIGDLKHIECLPVEDGAAANTWVGVHDDFVMAVHVPGALPQLQWAGSDSPPPMVWSRWVSERRPR